MFILPHRDRSKPYLIANIQHFRKDCNTEFKNINFNIKNYE